eukprot:XP_019081688.1 PREDICTED: uncharacterized protein LOC100251009 isoform X2 [Vitis vinifera]
MAKTLAIRPYLHSISRVRLFRGPLPIFQSSNLSFLPQHRLGDGFQKRQRLQIRDPKFMMVVQRFTTRATHVNDPGSIDSPLMQSMENKIKEHLNAESVSVKDAYGDGRHVSIDVSLIQYGWMYPTLSDKSLIYNQPTVVCTSVMKK